MTRWIVLGVGLVLAGCSTTNNFEAAKAAPAHAVDVPSPEQPSTLTLPQPEEDAGVIREAGVPVDAKLDAFVGVVADASTSDAASPEDASVDAANAADAADAADAAPLAPPASWPDPCSTCTKEHPANVCPPDQDGRASCCFVCPVDCFQPPPSKLVGGPYGFGCNAYPVTLASGGSDPSKRFWACSEGPFCNW